MGTWGHCMAALAKQPSVNVVVSDCLQETPIPSLLCLQGSSQKLLAALQGELMALIC